ncbi:hypothetical protein JTB14_004936 [Gonioctena quinquepunctata]|nr:hypothetical protein JTB14_004936 [Gonioctena quinquepunctata]
MKACNLWKKMQGIIDVFIRLSSVEDFVEIQLFTVMMYDVTSRQKQCMRVEEYSTLKRIEVWRIFHQPKEALRKHLRRAMLQTRVRKQCLELQPDIPKATNWGVEIIKFGM